MGLRVGRSGLFAGLLGTAFEKLDAPVQRVHGGNAGTYQGTASVERGAGWVAWMACTVARLPPTMRDAPLRFELRTRGAEEIWTRWFADAPPMSSRLEARDDLLLEHLGPATVQFALQLTGTALKWEATRLRIFGIPLPRRAFQFEALVRGDGGQYRFAIEARLAGAGLLIRYEGTLRG
jgi:hypothetical protein